MERQLIVCENDTRPTDPKAVQRRKLIINDKFLMFNNNKYKCKAKTSVQEGS